MHIHLIETTSWGGNIRTLSPTWTWPESTLPATLSPAPCPAERNNSKSNISSWKCNFSADLANHCTPLKTSPIQHLKGLSIGRVGLTNWSKCTHMGLHMKTNRKTTYVGAYKLVSCPDPHLKGLSTFSWLNRNSLQVHKLIIIIMPSSIQCVPQ